MNINKEKKKEIKLASDLKAAAQTEEDLDAKIDRELEESIKRADRDRKKAEKKERSKKHKSELRQKMSVIASSGIHNEDDEINIDRKTFQKLQDMEIEDDEYVKESEEEE